MKKTLRRVGAFGATAVLVGTLAAPAWGLGDTPGAKCNAGRGNGSEPAPPVDCDPAGSVGNNQGGD